MAAISLLPAHGGAPTGTGTGKNAQDIAVIDRAIASAPAGATRVMFGDCGMRISDLQTFRARLVAEQSTGQGAQPQAVTPTSSVFTKWTNGIIPYRFDPTQVSSGTITAAKEQQFRAGTGEWEAAANVQFVEFTGTPPANFITVQENSALGGGESTAVGMQGGEQFLQFGPTAWNRGTVCHEMGHALGYIHEQQRDDRDTYVIIDFNNIPTGQQANFTKLPGGAVEYGPYDFYSVMEYSRNALATNPSQDTITMQPAYAQYANIIGNVPDRTLSTLDRAGMASIYGNPSVLPGPIVTNTNDSGPGSLRSAIYYAFDRSTASPPQTTTISFQIPKTDPGYNSSSGTFTISPTYELDAPGDGTTIDGTTEATFVGVTNANGPSIVIDGSKFAQYETIGAGYQPGFILRQANCVLKNLVIHGCDAQGIQITGTAATGNVVSGCYIGTDATGATSVPNAYSGIEIYNGASNNTIGGTTVAARNILSGNTDLGVAIHDAGSNNNLIEGNYIGLTAAGTSALANLGGGIDFYNGAQRNTIGGTASGARNVISGNSYQGIVFTDAGTNSNVVEGNYIGLNAAGTAAVGNGFQNPSNHYYFPGVGIFNAAQNNIIGGTVTGSPNVISGNAGGGVSISGTGSNGNLVEGNFIGTNPAGSAAIANGNPEANYQYAGVELFGGTQSNTIGGLATAARNIISGNGAQGVFIGDVGTSSNLVEGNYIGTDVTGASALGNGYSGVGIFNSASGNTIGGTMAGSRNLISGNLNQGVAIGPASGQTVGPTLNIIEGNYIGVNAAGSAALGNATGGVDIFNASQSNTIGGATAGARNIISGNTYEDVAISDVGTSANAVQGNYIGLDATGAFSITNNNSGVGLFNGAQNNTIGGTAAGTGNFISGHQQYGLFIENSGTNGNFVQGNTIGLNISSAALGNTSIGIAIFDAAASNVIGGTAAGAGNIVANNAGGGIGLYNYTSNNTTIDNALSENSIFGNSSFGIYLYNGANNNQAAPALTSATSNTSGNPNGTDVVGTLTSAASTTYRLEFFSNPSGSQGQTFVGAANVTTNSSGTASFTVSLTTAVSKNYAMTATATDPSGNTSVFSAPVTVTSNGAGTQSQTITFPTIAAQTYSTTPIALNATASSGLPVSYSITSGPATVSGNALTITGVGSVTVQASQAGNASYSAAPPVSQTFTVSKASQTLTFPAISTQTAGASFPLNGSASSGLAVYYTTSGPVTISGNTATVTAAGSVSIRIHQDGNADYNAAPTILQTFTVTASTPQSQTITFPAIPNQTYPGSPVTLTATASSGLAVTYSIVSGPATVSGSTLTLTGAGTVTVQASQAGNASYSAAPNVQQTFTVTGSVQSQTITFPAIGAQTYTPTPITLGATASSGLPVSYSITSGPATVSGNALTITGVGTVVVQASQAGNASYSAATPVSQTFTVSKASQTLTFPAIPTQTVGASFPLNGSASSGLAVYYTSSGPVAISGNTATVTAAGSVSIRIHQDGNANYNAATTILQTFTVTKSSLQSQTITFPAIPNQSYPGSPVTLTATASSGLAVTYGIVSGPATVSGSTLTLTGAGTVVVQASQAGNTTYSPAPNVQQSFTVTGGVQSQTITFPTIGAQTYTPTPITLGATASSGLPVSYSITSGPATVSGNALTITGVGTVVVQATQAGNASYSAATPVSQSFTVSKASQTLTFPSIPTQTVGASFPLNGSASSGLAVYYTSSGPVTISGNTATVTAAGSVSIRIHQDGNANYNAATTILQTFTVTKSGSQSQTITFPAIPNQSYPGSPVTLSATASSGLAVTYSIVSGPATVSGSTLTLTGTGTVTVQASQAGNATYTAAPNVQQSFTVSGSVQSQTITFPTIGAQTYTPTPITLGATASSGLPVSYSITSGPATVSGNALTITGVGTVVVQASQPGNASYSAATPVSQSFTVSKASQTLTFPTIPTQTAGASFPLNGSASSGLAVYYTTAGPITVSGNTATVTAAGSVSIRIHQDGNADYNAATTIVQTFTVTKAP